MNRAVCEEKFKTDFYETSEVSLDTLHLGTNILVRLHCPFPNPINDHYDMKKLYIANQANVPKNSNKFNNIYTQFNIIFKKTLGDITSMADIEVVSN